eukprot:symbB.v1.2.013883.t1/scaffold997.1/size145858/2
MFEITSEASEDDMPPDEIPPEAQETVPNPRRSAERLRINSSAVHRMVSSHISKKETADVKDQGNLWANWNPSHRNAEPEHDWGREQVHNGQYNGRSSGSSRPAHIRPRKSAPGEASNWWRLVVIGISGEGMLTLNVADSMLGRDLWKTILDKVPCKPGLQLAVSHSSRLVLHESLQQQGLGGQRAQVCATYMPVNLHDSWRFAHGYSVEDAEFSLNGITEVTGVDDSMPALLHNLPKSLRTLNFHRRFNQEIHGMRFPANLRNLTFGQNFNRSLDKVTWPEGLQSLSFGWYFNQSLDNVTWPAGLQSLTFGGYFNQSLDNVTWPAGLRSLTSGMYFNQSLDNVTWPAGLRSLSFGLRSLSFGWYFNQSLDHVTWPAGLESLTFGVDFNQSLDNVTWPAGLQSLTFGQDFNQNLDNVTWPEGLHSLTFRGCFDQNLDNVTWPAGLQSLTFRSGDFNQSLDNVTWPAGLQSLTFGVKFNQNLGNVTWPEGLQSLTFGQDFNQNLDNVTWPAGLQSLTFGKNFDQNLDNVTWPAGLQSLTFGDLFNQCLDNVTWSEGLQSLTFGQFFNQSLDKVPWPAAIQSLTFPRNYESLRDSHVLPGALDSWTTREVLQATENHLEEFDVVHSVVALHRIAKSTDFRELRSSNKLREQLASLASNAADAVQPGPDGEVPHVKEVSKALWALAKVGPWSDSMEGYAPRSSNVDWGRGWSSVHRSLQALGYMALDRLAELDSHGLSNVAWSFAVARMNGTGTQVATVALEILPDFQAQGLANTAWAMARLLADYEATGPFFGEESEERHTLTFSCDMVAKSHFRDIDSSLAVLSW